MLTHPPLIDAHPGDPITSEGWNNLLQSVKTLYDALNKPQGTLVFKVLDKTDSQPIEGSLVSLVRKDGTLFRSAAFVGGSLRAYVAIDVPLGSYSVNVETRDYAVETRDLEVIESEANQESTILLTRISVKISMPNLFG